MNDGSLSQEPEMELERRATEEAGPISSKRVRLDMNDDNDVQSEGRSKKRRRGQASEPQSEVAPTGGSGGGIQGDDFFATGSDDE